MKKLKHIFLAITALFLITSASGQQIADLEGINYQAVAIDEEGKEIVGMDVEGKPLYEKAIGVRFTIQSDADGPIYYQETHEALTDKYGLFSLVIGHGEVTAESQYAELMEIPWINGDQFLKVEIAQKNDGNFKMVSNQKLMAVPYSYYTDDIADDAITTSKILNEEILAEDIATGAVTTDEILDETILAEDIGTGSVETSEILDETILAEDIATGAVTTDEILDETIQAADIDTGAVETSEILNETILAEDIATGAVESSEILNGTILNEDIANGTIDLTQKVTNELPVQNGGTGLDGSTATDGQLLIGNGTGYSLDTLSAGTGIIITNSPGGITISSGVQGVSTEETGSVNVGVMDPGEVYIVQVTLNGVAPGDFVVASYSNPLQGCLMSGYVRNNNQIEVVIYNPQTTSKNLSSGTFKVLVIK